jgi:hypothetical protein
MNTNSRIISISEIRDIFQEDCQSQEKQFKREEFVEFLDFLEIDFYDWVRGNLNQFWINKVQK